MEALGRNVSIGITTVSLRVTPQPIAGEADTIYVPGFVIDSCELSELEPEIFPPLKVCQV